MSQNGVMATPWQAEDVYSKTSTSDADGGKDGARVGECAKLNLVGGENGECATS